MRLFIFFVISLWMVTFLDAQSRLDGSNFSVRLAASLEAKSDIRPLYVVPTGVDLHSKPTLGDELGLAYRLTKPHCRYTAAAKVGWYGLSQKLSLDSTQSAAGYDIVEQLITRPFYFGLETSVEARLKIWKNTSLFIGPALQLVYTPTNQFEFYYGYSDSNGNSHYVYVDKTILNTPNRPYLGIGGKFSVEKPIGKRVGAAITLAYFYNRRDLLDAGTYTIYTLNGPLSGTFTKPFQYWLFGLEFSLLRKKG